MSSSSYAKRIRARVSRRDVLAGLGITTTAFVAPWLTACNSKPKTPLAHLYGEGWVSGSYEAYAKGYQELELAAKDQSFGVYGELAGRGVSALDGLQSRGVPFAITVTDGGAGFAIVRDVPERLTFKAGMSEDERAQATAAWENARDHIHKDYAEIQRLDRSLTSLLGGVQRVRSVADASVEEQYSLVAQLEDTVEGPPPFELPYQVKLGDYRNVLYLLLPRLEDEQARLESLESSMLSVGLTARATDEGSGSRADNLRRVLLAVSDDAAAVEQQSTSYPDASTRDERLAAGKTLYEEIRQTPEYQAFRKRQQAQAFEAIGSFLVVFDQATGIPVSSIYRQAISLWQGSDDYLGYLKLAVRLAPGGSELSGVLDDAVDLTDKARRVVSVGEAAISDGGELEGVLLNTATDYGRARLNRQLAFFESNEQAQTVAADLAARAWTR